MSASPSFPSDSSPDSIIPETAPTAGDSAGSFLHSFWSLGFVSVSAFVFNVILARILGIEDFGHIRIVRTVLEFCAIPGAIGMGACVAKHAADARIGEPERSAMLSTGLILSLFGSFAFALLIFVSLFAPSVVRDAEARNILKWMIFLLPSIALYGCVMGYFQGTGRIKPLAYAQAGRSAFMLVAGVIFSKFWGLIGWSVSRAMTELSALAIAARGISLADIPKPERRFVRTFLIFGANAAITQTLTALIITVDVLCLDHFRNDAAEIARYGVAMQILATALLLPNAFVQANFHQMAAYGHDPVKSWEIYLRHTGIVLVMVAPCAVLGYWAAPIVPWVFGANYAESATIFRWLLPAFVIQSAGIIGGNYVFGAGLMRANLISIVISAVANLALNIALIPRLGIPGAVMATTGTYALKTFLAWFIMLQYRRRHSPMDPLL